MRQIAIAFWIVIVLFFVFVAMALLGMLFLASQNISKGEMTLDSTRRYQAIADLAYLSVEMAIKDRTTYPTDDVRCVFPFFSSIIHSSWHRSS